MADIWDSIGVTPYVADPSKAKLPLGQNKTASAKQPPQSQYDKVLDSDTTLGSLLRGLAATGGRTLSYVNAGAEALGFDPVVSPREIDGKLNYLEQRKEQIVEKDMSPTRKREVDAIKKEVDKAQGWDSVLPIAKQIGDTLIHPSEWTAQGVVENFSPSDPLNLAGIGAGSILAKPAKSIIAKTLIGGAGGAAEGAVIGGAGEYASAVGRGQSDEQAKKAAIAGTVGGGLTGSVMGAGAGVMSKPRFASDNILSKVDQHIGTHEVNHSALMDNALMQTPDGEKFDPNTDIGFTSEAPSVTDHPADTLPDVDHHAVYNSVIADMLDSARSENTKVYNQARLMAESGATPEQMKSYIDNAFTPTRDDLSIDDLLNGGEPMPSRLSGMRIIDTLERNIAIAINDPMGARTNDQIKAALKKEGVSNEYAGVFTKAYAAKDPTILTEYIDAKTAPLRDEIRAVIDERIGTYKTQAEEQKALRWANTVPESAQDLVNHPKFIEHLNERADVSASDARYAQVRTSDLTLSHENNGGGYETVVQQPAQFDRNYNYDFEMTKKDVADVKAGRWSDELIQKLRNDLDRRDNDLLYNPETPSMRLHREMSDAVGVDQADMNMALIDGRAKAMGITPDELIDRSGLSVENMRDFDGAQYVNDLKEADQLFQVGDMAKRFMSDNGNLLKNKMKSEAKEYIPHESYIDPDTPDGVSQYHDIFGDGIVKTPDIFKDVYFDFSQYKKLDQRYNEHGENRTNLLGAIKDTLESPQYVVDFDGISMFMKFYKQQGKSDPVRFVGVVKDKNGNAYVTSSHDLYRDSKLMKVFKYGDLVAERLPDGTYVTRTTASPVLAPSGKPKGSGTVPNNSQANGILHQNGTNVKPTLKTVNDTVILKDWMQFESDVKNGKIDAITDKNQPGWISAKEIDDARISIKNSTPYMEGDARIYEYRNDHGNTFRIISDKDGFRMHSDRVAGEGKESGGYDYTPQHEDARRLHQKIPDVKLTDDQINGMAELGIHEGDMKSVIYLFKTADPSTLPHELMHVFERTLSDVERAAVDDVLKDYAPGTPRKEALARYFEKYLADGEAPTPELKGVFEKFRDWLTSLWENIVHDGSRNFKLTDAHRELYRALLGDREAAAKLSERYDGIVNEQIRAEAEVLFQHGEDGTSNLQMAKPSTTKSELESIFKSKRREDFVDKSTGVKYTYYKSGGRGTKSGWFVHKDTIPNSMKDDFERQRIEAEKDAEDFRVRQEEDAIKREEWKKEAEIRNEKARLALIEREKMLEKYPEPLRDMIDNDGNFLGFSHENRSWNGGGKGYDGYSQSRNALIAKTEGKFPKTSAAKILGVSAAKIDKFLSPSEWHHTSKQYNTTDFYDIRPYYYLKEGDLENFNRYLDDMDDSDNRQFYMDTWVEMSSKQTKRSPEILFQKMNKETKHVQSKTYTATKNIFEQMIDGIGSAIEKGADKLPDGVRPWLHPTKAQQLFAEYQSAMREETARIWEQAREVKEYLANNTMSENSSSDLVRALSGDMDADKLSDDLKPIYTQMRKVIDANAQALIDVGALDEKHAIKDYLKRYYEKHEKELGFFKKSLSMGKKFARKDLTHDERLALGLLEDASLVIPNTLAEQRIQLMQAKLLKQISDDFAVAEPRDGYAMISDESVSHNGSVKKYGALAGKYVPIELKDAMMDLGRGMGDLSAVQKAAQGYISFIRNIKTTVTVKNPMTHAVNVGSNMTMAYLNGHLTPLAKTLSSIGSPHFKELVRLARENGMTTQLDMLEARDAVKIGTASGDAITSKLANIVKNIYMTQDSKWGKSVREAYDWEDRIFKLAAFDDQINKMKKQLGRDLSDAEIKQAFREANDMYIDYNKPLPHAVQVLDDTGLMPFVGYTYRSIPQVAKTIARNPWRFMLMQAAIAGMGMSTLFNDDDDMAKPSWAQDGFNFFGIKNWTYVGNSGWAVNSGRLVPGLRFTDLTFEGGFVKSLINIASGTDPLWGSALSKEDDPRYVKLFNIAQKYAESFTPSITPTGRYGQRLIDPGKNPSTGEDRTRGEVVAQAVAVRKFDPENELQKKANKAFKDMGEKALISEETGNGQHVKKYADPKTVQEAKAEYKEKMQPIQEQAKKKGVSLELGDLKSTAEKRSGGGFPRLPL